MKLFKFYNYKEFNNNEFFVLANTMAEAFDLFQQQMVEKEKSKFSEKLYIEDVTHIFFFNTLPKSK